MFYAIWEEQVAQDPPRAKAVYEKSLTVIPHKQFTFSKIWIQYSTFLIRESKLSDARKLLGGALGKYPKPKLYKVSNNQLVLINHLKAYIAQELQLREFDRTRTLYQKFLEHQGALCLTWIKFAELEVALGETDRARGIFEIALDQTELDMPEVPEIFD